MMTATTAPPVGTVAPPTQTARRWGGPATALVVAVAWFVTVASTGSPVGDVAKWIAAVLAAVLAPGWVLVRVSRRAVAPLIEDIAWAAPAGCLVAMVGWFGDRVLPFVTGTYVLGPLVVLIALAVPWSRRRVLARPAPGWGFTPALVIGGVVVFALGWMLRTGLLAQRPDPGPHGTIYFPDLIYNLSLVGELNHHLAPTYPPVDGATLSYHWFLFAITSHLTDHSGVNTFDATLRLGAATLVPAMLLLVAVVARRIADRVWAGPLAAALLGAVELSQASRWTTEDGSIGILRRAWLGNTPMNLGWLVGLAAAGTVVGFLRRSPVDRAVPVALLIPFLVLAAGAKSTDVVVIGAGLGLAFAVQVVRRDRQQAVRCLLAGGACLAVFGAASVTIYRGSSYGLHLRLFGTALNRVPAEFPGYATRVNSLYITGLHYSRVALLTAAVLWLLPLLPRVAGLLFLVRYRPRDSVGWFCLGTTAAGLLIPLLVQHPASSEIYFAQSAYPIGVAGAAAGLVLAADRIRSAYVSPIVRRRAAVLVGLFVVVGLVASAVIASAQPANDPVTQWTDGHPGAAIASVVPVRRLAWLWLRPTTLLIVVILVSAAGAAFAVRRWLGRPSASRPPIVWLSALAVAVGSGVFTMALTFHGTTQPVAGSRKMWAVYDASLRKHGALPTERDAFAAGRYIDEHAGADDVVATNMICRYRRSVRRAQHLPCDARNFLASALTERRTLVGGWAYADRVVSDAWTQTVRYNNEAFWDQPLQAEQYAAIAHPTATVLADLYRHRHVRWIMVDLRDRPVDVAGLDRLAVRRFAGPTTAAWQLRSP